MFHISTHPGIPLQPTYNAINCFNLWEEKISLKFFFKICHLWGSSLWIVDKYQLLPFKCDFDFKISFNDIHEPTCILCRTSFYVLFMLLNFQHDAICFVDVDIWNGEWGGGGCCVSVSIHVTLQKLSFYLS